MTKRSLAAIVAATAVLVPPWLGVARAQADEPWQFQGSVYLYLPTISGQTAFGPPPGSDSSVGVDPKTILENLKMAFMGSLEARRGRWGALTDIVYVDVEGTKSGTRQLSLGGVPLPIDVAADLNYRIRGTVWTLAGSWRVIPDPDGSPIDLFAGARMLDVKQKLGWQLSGNLGAIAPEGTAGSASTDLRNWDAIIGIKGRITPGAERKVFVPFHIDVGTGMSHVTAQEMIGIGYTFGWGDVVLSWRRLDYQMKSGSKVESLQFDGPSIAVAWRW